MAPPPAIVSAARTTTAGPSGSSSSNYTPPPPPIRSSALSPPPSSLAKSTTREAGLNGNAVALYDFTPQGEDELQVEEGDRLIVVRGGSDDPDWVKVRKVGSGEEGIVPASYVEVSTFLSIFGLVGREILMYFFFIFFAFGMG